MRYFFILALAVYVTCYSLAPFKELLSELQYHKTQVERVIAMP